MSLNAAEIGRVQSIKSKFENLNAIESVDISASIPIKCHRPSPKLLFKRSSTAIDIPINRDRIANGKAATINGSVQSVCSAAKNLLRRHNESDEPVITHTIKKRSLIATNSAQDTLKPLKENVEMRLNRHTNDPVKRSSIKRSPAFRVGDRSTTSNNSNSNSNSNSCSNSSGNNGKSDKLNGKLSSVQRTVQRALNESSKKFDAFLSRCETDTKQQLQEVGLTDTLKAFLRQPLPSGPPPKKPPRTFCDAPAASRAIQSKVTGGDVAQKVDLLKSKLILKPAIALKPNEKKHIAVRGIKMQPSSSNGGLLKCISCTADESAYDSIIISHNPTKAVRTSRERVMLDTTNSRKTMPTPSGSGQTIVKRSSTGRPGDEPVYMEPFAHLTAANKSNAINVPARGSPSMTSSESNHTSPIASGNRTIETKLSSSSISNGSLDGGESLGSSLVSNCTSCTADDHLLIAHDIHYMCTNIENKIKSSDSDSTSNDNDHSLPMTNTYDEINILVNAAFGQRKADDDTLRVGTDSIDSTGILSADSGTTGSAQSLKPSTKLCRKLTEKRKDYVRRVSAVKNQIPDDIFAPNESPHQTFKPSVFRTFSIDDTDADEPNCDPCAVAATAPPIPTSVVSMVSSAEHQSIDADQAVDVLDAPSYNANESNHVDTDPSKSVKLFQVCLLIGYNSSTQQAYIKSKFPADEDIPPNIEQLVFPSTSAVNQTRPNQDYTIILTDSDGYHVYGYCRRVLPESCETCLPLAYCIISEVRAPGFYFKILKEIESRHGQAICQTNFLLENLQNRPIPGAGQFLHLKMPVSPKPKTIASTVQHKMMPKRLNLDANPKWLTESATQAVFNSVDTAPEPVNRPRKERRRQDGDDKKPSPSHAATFDLSLINRSLLNDKCDEILIRRPNDLRLESMELSDVYNALGPELLTVVFSTLLLERKVILYSENIAVLSSSILGLQTLLYPFQWQHALITILPQKLVEICQAPIPVLAGILKPIPFDIEDGIVIDLNKRQIVQKCGDETTILPSRLAHSLRVSLQMADLLDQGRMLSSVLISKAFLRCFVELFVVYKHKHYDKKLFIESHTSQSYRLFLEWFVETAMFRCFVQQKFAHSNGPAVRGGNDADAVESTFYDLFDSCILESESNSNTTIHNIEMIVKKSRLIKKKKTFKDRFKDFLGNSTNAN